jgi:hypothetical protein
MGSHVPKLVMPILTKDPAVSPAGSLPYDRLGSLSRPRTSADRLRVADTIAMITPGIDTFQGHQALSIGS